MNATAEKLYPADTVIDAFNNGLKKGKDIDPNVLINFLLRLKNVECWCAFGADDPRYKTHTDLCKEIQDFIKDFKK